MSPVALLFCVLAWALAARLTRYVSVASLAGVTAAVIAALLHVFIFDLSPIYLIYFGIGAFIIFWQHSDNIHRLRQGTEPRLGHRAETVDPD